MGLATKIFVAIFAVYAAFTLVSLQIQISAKRERQAALQAQIEEQSLRNAEIEALLNSEDNDEATLRASRVTSWAMCHRASVCLSIFPANKGFRRTAQVDNDLQVGSIYEGKVTGITKFGAFVSLPGGKIGHGAYSEVANAYVDDIHNYLTEGQTVTVKLIGIDQLNRINLVGQKSCARAAGRCCASRFSCAAPPPEIRRQLV